MNYSVYILFSKSRNLFYVGISSDVQKRVLYHNGMNEGFTSSGIPWILLWLTEKSTKREAELLERKIKNLSVNRKLSFMQKYEEGIQDCEFLNDLIKNLGSMKS